MACPATFGAIAEGNRPRNPKNDPGYQSNPPFPKKMAHLRLEDVLQERTPTVTRKEADNEADQGNGQIELQLTSLYPPKP